MWLSVPTTADEDAVKSDSEFFGMICLTMKCLWLLEQETSKPNKPETKGETREHPASDNKLCALYSNNSSGYANHLDRKYSSVWDAMP
ncbi:hypothetical protein HGM15179_006511 [Zosterops borbonicus]|uniref:Uncharacterized protein n=1 Tax=Zosterops borbonicus TaxID=364589 RepID=A0A8K1LNM6_9PASS|nr:hypothetical protein HGM15179_006511 [Zosterops borbonicus]